MRRVRTIMQGRIAKYFEFRLMPDFGSGTTVLYDAYFDVRFSQAFRVRIGKDKTPVGLEQLYSDYALLFPERSLATNLVPNRDVGVQVQGRLAGVLSYIGGVFNGVPDAANGDVDSGAGKDLAGRITVRPFARTNAAALREAGVAVGATSGTQARRAPRLPEHGPAGVLCLCGRAPSRRAIARACRRRPSTTTGRSARSANTRGPRRRSAACAASDTPDEHGVGHHGVVRAHRRGRQRARRRSVAAVRSGTAALRRRADDGALQPPRRRSVRVRKQPGRAPGRARPRAPPASGSRCTRPRP